MDSDQANNDALEATEALAQLNSLYQDIELILRSEQTQDNKLAAISVKNREIGNITAQFI